MVAVNYDIPDELHRRCKIAAAQQGVTLRDFLLRALEEQVEAAEKDTKRPKR
jgi:predicted HicB family RNase H-like nuclease